MNEYNSAASSSCLSMNFNCNNDQTNLSRRSVDWRDSGIVIDEDQLIFHERPTVIRAPTRITYDQDDDGDTILHLAVVGFSLQKVYDLIQVCDLNAINNMMQTPLHIAVIANKPEVVESLVSSGAKMDIRDRRGNTPLHLACQLGQNEMVESLLQKFSSTNPSLLTQYVSAANFDGQTCVHLAAQKNQHQIINTLTRYYQADVNCRDSKSGETIMHKAICQFNVNLVKFILDLEAHCNAADFAGRDPMGTVRLLRESRLDKDSYDKLSAIEQLIYIRINKCIAQGGCCKGSKYDQSAATNAILNDSSSSSSSECSDSDYE